jgi:hypothetical protein
MRDRHINSNPEPKAPSRGEIESDILQQVRDEVWEAIVLHAPQSWSQARREAVEESVLAETRLVLDALSTNELRSSGALRSHIGRAIDETKRLIRQGGVRTTS